MKFWKLAAALCTLLVILVGLTFTALRKHTYIITDGDSVIQYTSFCPDADTALSEIGIRLHPEDSRSIQHSATATYITLQRSQSVTLRQGDACTQLRTDGETVGQLLERLDVRLLSTQRLNYPRETDTFDGMVLQISDVTCRETTRRYTLPIQEIRLESRDLAPGEEIVLSEGAEGMMAQTILTTYIDGQENGQEVLSEELLQAGSDRIVLYGVARQANAVLLSAASAPAEHLPAAQAHTFTTPSGEVVRYKRMLSCTATAYSCEGYTGTTAIGTTARVGAVAVDPKVIPYGTKLYILTDDGAYVYGYATAEDCGNFKGNHIDLYFDTEDECWQFGRRSCKVYILED